jgi:hypothetical protein
MFIAALAMTAAGAPEVRVALTPRISLPKDLPVYQEDSANFYGTNTLLFQSRMLRKRVEMEIGHALPSTLKFTASRIPNTSIITVTATGADDSAAVPFLNALVNQFLQFKTEQKKQFYREAITRVESAMQSAPPEAAEQLQKYKAQLVVASLLDTESDFRRPEEIQ